MSIAEQVSAIRRKYSTFEVTFTHLVLRAVGTLQPTARSESYTVRIKYRLLQPPEISVLKPKLVKNFKGDAIPHVYPGEKLCLYLPGRGEFQHSDFLADTILPWTSLWLYYYEDWHITGDWHGGGEHPKREGSWQ